MIDDQTSVVWPLVADRFARVVNRAGEIHWCDLATTDRVDVDVAKLPHQGEAQEGRLAWEIEHGQGRAIDGGRLGVAGWFVARMQGAALSPCDRHTREVVAVLCELAEQPNTGGPRVLAVRRETVDVRALIRVLARSFRIRGYAVVNARIPAWPSMLAYFGRRHVCLVVEEHGENAARWVRGLTAASPRSHLVVDCAARAKQVERLRFPARLRLVESSVETEVRRAHGLLRGGDFERAEAALASVAVEARVRGRPSSQAAALVRAELCFWQGRLDEGMRLLERAGPSPRALRTRGLLAWRAGNAERVSAIAQALGTYGECTPARQLWVCALSLLAASLVPSRNRVAASAARLTAFARARWGPEDRLAFLVSAAAAIACDHARWARRILGPRRAWRAATPIERLVLSWLGTSDGEPDRQAVMARIEQMGAVGLREWTMRSHTMQLVQALPAMLQAVHDAENDLAALGAAGEWMRRECGAEAVAFFTADQPTRMAVSGWTAADTVALITASGGHLSDGCHRGAGATLFVSASVRYAGTTIARVVVKGRVERQAALDEATRMIAAVSGAACRARLDAVLASSRSHSAMPEILGRSPAIATLREAIVQAAATPFSVLIEGESGTGKELTARAIHRLSARRDRRCCAVNCAAITDELVEAELFGHARGAFTGAVGLRTGLFEDAHGGTLFLDEVSELSPRAQAKILRALQEREVRRVGENNARPIDVRVIAATNRPLTELVAQAGFREDLLFRLAVVRIKLPPLRDRIEDIPLLAESCWRSLAAQAAKRAVLGADALAALCRHNWPGNVREFQNIIAALVVSAPVRGRVGARHVHHVLAVNTTAAREETVVPLHQLRMTCERRAVAGALAQCRGRRAEAARALGLSRQGLTKAIRRLGLDRPRDIAGVA